MRSAALFLGALLGSFLAAFGYTLYTRDLDLAAENQELRLRDANRARIQQLHKGQLLVPTENVQNAAYDMGTDPGILWDVAQTERGGPIYEMGHAGKTAFIWLSVPPDQTQEYEAARSLNKALWAWALKTHKQEAIRALGHAYTAPVNAAKWAKNVSKLEARHANRD